MDRRADWIARGASLLVLAAVAASFLVDSHYAWSRPEEEGGVADYRMGFEGVRGTLTLPDGSREVQQQTYMLMIAQMQGFLASWGDNTDKGTAALRRYERLAGAGSLHLASIVAAAAAAVAGWWVRRRGLRAALVAGAGVIGAAGLGWFLRVASEFVESIPGVTSRGPTATAWAAGTACALAVAASLVAWRAARPCPEAGTGTAGA